MDFWDNDFSFKALDLYEQLYMDIYNAYVYLIYIACSSLILN